VNTLWLANGLLFYVLLFATGQWRRLVPTSWDAFPHALSVMVQYASLDWPTENGWVAYNSLQQIAYFLTVFIAAPLAVLTGLGMSPTLSTRFKRISTVLSIQTARSLHFLVLIWFLVFITTHIALVATTGVLRNLNHIYTGRDGTDWVGFAVFAASMVIVTVGWVAATPLTLRHPRLVQRVGYALIGPVQRLFEHVDATPGQYTEKDISPYLWHNGKYPDSAEYTALLAGDFTDYRLRVNGLVEHPVELDLAQLRALAHTEQITQHFCIQGWSGIAKWGGVSMQALMDLVQPHAEAKWVVFYSLADGSDGGVYYDAHPIEQMSYHLTMLAYDMNDQPLSFGHGAPLRLRNEVQLGFKQVKWIKGVEFVAHYSEVGGGQGGYNQDHEFSATGSPSNPLRTPHGPAQRNSAQHGEASPTGRPVTSRTTRPTGHDMQKSSLTALARQQLELAHGASSGRSSSTVYGGHEHQLRQTVIALSAGQMLSEHENPGEATVPSCTVGSGSAPARRPGTAHPGTCWSCRTLGTPWRPSRTPRYCSLSPSTHERPAAPPPTPDRPADPVRRPAATSADRPSRRRPGRSSRGDDTRVVRALGALRLLQLSLVLPGQPAQRPAHRPPRQAAVAHGRPRPAPVRHRTAPGRPRPLSLADPARRGRRRAASR